MGNNMRYARSQMMPRMTNGCNSCTASRMGSTRNSSSSMNNNYDTYSNSSMNNNYDNCESCGNSRTTTVCNDCSNTRDELKGMPIAMAYVPWQEFSCTYEAMQGLQAGTIFPELEKPFYGTRRMR